MDRLYWPMTALGVCGTVLFNGRFYLQWIVSEMRGRSVMPVAFWYLSCVGAVSLFLYASYTHSAVGTLSYCFNLVIYARNLVHIWREHGKLTKFRSWAAHGLAGGLMLAALAVTAYIWLNKYHATHATEEAHRTWFWIAVGVLGTGLFALRFAIQWAVTEYKKKSVVPVSFWHCSWLAAFCLTASFVQQQEWLLAAGVACPLPVYFRNLWLIHKHVEPAAEEG